MSRGFRFASLLRARQAQEDVAKSAVSRARTAKDSAHHAAAERERTLHATSAPPAGTAHAVVAAIAAQRAMAAGLAAARQMALEAERNHAERLDDLAIAAGRRRTVERMAERHAEDRQRAELAAEQRALDEIAARFGTELGGTA
jgi:flagellar export protein FliJ